MEVILLVAVVLVSGLACPAVMWWNRRWGRDAACCVPRETDELAELRERQAQLGALIVEARRGRIERGG